MLSIKSDADGVEVVAQINGAAVYLDNWAIIELAVGDGERRKRFVKALRSCGSLLFSYTNSLEIGDAEGGPAAKVRGFLDEIGPNWIPVEINPWTVAKREEAGELDPTPCFSRTFAESFTKDRYKELMAESGGAPDTAENFFKLSAVMTWANSVKAESQSDIAKLDETFIKRVADDYADFKKDATTIDKQTPEVLFESDKPARFALTNLLRLLVKESKSFTLKKGDGRDLCHAVLGGAYGNFAALDKHWKRRVEALPKPNNLSRIYYAGELDQLVTDLEAFAVEHEKAKAK